MIYCSHEDIEKYKGLGERLERALSFAENEDLTILPPGKTEIDGKDIFINRMNYQTAESSESLWESHITYIDIHIVLKGREQIFVSNKKNMKETGRNENEDFIGYEGEEEAHCKMDVSKILLLFPEDVHKVKIMHGASTHVEKAVIKVKLD